MPVKLAEDQGQAVVDEWQKQVGLLLDQVQGWAQSQGWQVARTENSIREDELPEYSIQTLVIQLKGERRVMLEPIARLTLNGRGVVELSGWPSMRRVRLQPETATGGHGAWV